MVTVLQIYDKAGKKIVDKATCDCAPFIALRDIILGISIGVLLFNILVI